MVSDERMRVPSSEPPHSTLNEVSFIYFHITEFHLPCFQRAYHNALYVDDVKIFPDEVIERIK